jgi:hypothetical protein
VGRAALILALGLVRLAGAQTLEDEKAPPYKFATTVTGEPLYKFGTTVVAASGFKGLVYFLEPGTGSLPKFSKLKPVGTIYTPYLCVPPQDFSEGFPGVSRRYEWFAIDYSGRFWISEPGSYLFSLLSDDGSKLYIDGKTIIDNDGTHGPESRDGGVKLKPGVHTIRVSYFQGPRFHVALILGVAGPKQKLPRIFNLDDFKPPPDAPGWTDENEPPRKK